MKRIAISLLLATGVVSVWAQYATQGTAIKGAGDLIESTSFNDHKRGTERRLQYIPEGEDFVCTNG